MFDPERTANIRTHSSQSTSGQAKAEYAIAISLVALLVIGVLVVAGPRIRDTIDSAEDVLEGPTPTPTEPPSPTPTDIHTPTPTTQPDERISHSDFEDGTSSEWYDAAGKNWDVRDGEYCASSGGEHRSFTGDESWTDYTVELQANLSQGNGYGIYFRATDPDRVNAYCFQYNPGHGHGAFLFRKVVNGHEKSPSVVAWANKDYNWHTGPRDIRLEVVGSTYTAYVDGVQVAQLEDSSYMHGAVGLRTWDSSDACFDNVNVTRIK
jgi:hypothetical protein